MAPLFAQTLGTRRLADIGTSYRTPIRETFVNETSGVTVLINPCLR